MYSNTKVDCIIYGNGRHPVVEQYKELKKNFSFDGKGVKEIFVFHGTDDSSIKKIINEGFKVGGSDGIPIKNGSFMLFVLSQVEIF
jgi:hypothetical protein